MSDENRRWVVVCEAREDFEAATGLADRIILEKVDWAEELLKHLRTWSGVEGSTDFTKWKSIKRLASKHGVRVHGKFGRGHVRGGAVEARKALAVVDKAEQDLSAVVLLRDLDGHTKGARSNKQIRSRRSASSSAMRFDPSMAGSCDGRTEAAEEVRNKRGDLFIVACALSA